MMVILSDCERMEGIVLAVSELLHEGLADFLVGVEKINVESMEVAASGDCLASKLKELVSVIVFHAPQALDLE